MRKRYFLSSICLFFLLLYFLPGYASNGPTKYKLESIKKNLIKDIKPIDFNDDGVEELLVIYPNEINVRDSELEHNLQAFIIPRDKKYGITPIITGHLDSLCFLFSYSTKDSSVYRLLRYTNDGVTEKKDTLNYIIFSGVDRDGDGDFHQTIKPRGYLYNSSGERLDMFERL